MPSTLLAFLVGFPRLETSLLVTIEILHLIPVWMYFLYSISSLLWYFLLLSLIHFLYMNNYSEKYNFEGSRANEHKISNSFSLQPHSPSESIMSDDIFKIDPLFFSQAVGILAGTYMKQKPFKSRFISRSINYPCCQT